MITSYLGISLAMKKKLKKIDASSTYNASSGDFIPLACHYDPHTLLTKNGELIQTFQINGINSETISKTLYDLRSMVRKTVKSNVDSYNFAFWIHTIRKKVNLDDDTEYNSYFSANVHDLWQRKNFWQDKFVNTLYITVVHDSCALKVNDFNTMMNSLSKNTIVNFEDDFHQKACNHLTQVVDRMLEELSEFGASKLGIREQEGKIYSDLMFLYRRIMQLNEHDCLLPITDISTALSSHQYAVGTDVVEVTGNENKQFAAIMSIKEYQEISAEAIDKFLQIPMGMVATEVFYFVDKKTVIPEFKHQEYMLKVSGDNELNELKGLDKIITSDKNQFGHCKQQISFMVIGDSLAELEQKVVQSSTVLSDIGIVHVREDINLEKAFWAQLPGNFSFLSRMNSTVLDNTTALASLHNFPTGNKYSPWGNALTLLRTEKGTPYFFNFHDQDAKAFTAIAGIDNSGRTTLMNFLLSEADKYNPTILHFVDDLDSGVCVKARGGNWIQRQRQILNPFLVKDNDEGRKEVFEFLKIITNHHFNPLKDSELGLLATIVDKIFKLPEEERILSDIIDNIKDTEKGGKGLRERLDIFAKDSVFHEVFEGNEEFSLEQINYFCFNLQAFDDEAYHIKNYPKEKKLIEKYEYDLDSMRSVKAGIIYSLSRAMLKTDPKTPKILAIDNLLGIINTKRYSWLVELLCDEMNQNNGAFLVTLSLDTLKEFYKSKVDLKWLKLINTKFILPPELKMKELANLFDLNKIEMNKLFDLSPTTKSFLINQDGKSIASELSIGGLPGITRILSSTKTERDEYRKLIEKLGEDIADWVAPLYESLDKQA